MSSLSTSCVGRVSGKPLASYDSEAEALDGAMYAQNRYGSAMVAYRCRHCSCWHLAPADRQTPSETSSACHGREGQPKARYASQADAERRAGILLREEGVYLRVYGCGCGGWHLTKG